MAGRQAWHCLGLWMVDFLAKVCNEALNPKPYTQNPKPSAPNPNVSSLNPRVSGLFGIFEEFYRVVDPLSSLAFRLRFKMSERDVLKSLGGLTGGHSKEYQWIRASFFA